MVLFDDMGPLREEWVFCFALRGIVDAVGTQPTSQALPNLCTLVGSTCQYLHLFAWDLSPKLQKPLCVPSTPHRSSPQSLTLGSWCVDNPGPSPRWDGTNVVTCVLYTISQGSPGELNSNPPSSS